MDVSCISQIEENIAQLVEQQIKLSKASSSLCNEMSLLDDQVLEFRKQMDRIKFDSLREELKKLRWNMSIIPVSLNTNDLRYNLTSQTLFESKIELCGFRVYSHTIFSNIENLKPEFYIQSIDELKLLVKEYELNIVSCQDLQKLIDICDTIRKIYFVSTLK